MAFKINIALKGKTYKGESDTEFLIGKKIGEQFDGEELLPEFKGYVLEIRGTSDISGIPGFKGLEGTYYHRRLLTYGQGMKNRERGLRTRKTNRGEEISSKTIQVNLFVVKEGEKSFAQMTKKEEKKE